MHNMEIERKFLIKKMPDLSDLKVLRSERFFIFIWNWIELRIQSKDDKYELERKEKISDLSREWIKVNISKEEFDILKEKSSKFLIRDNYYLWNNVSIKIYHWEFEWLIRYEVEFDSEKDANNFIKPDFIWKEITDSPLWKDSKLINLSKEEFIKLINK